jgi:hypothetical protein
MVHRTPLPEPDDFESASNQLINTGSLACLAAECPAVNKPVVKLSVPFLPADFGRPDMTISAVGSSASTALSILSSAGSASSSSSSSASSDTTTVATAPDGTVTTTVTAASGEVISVTVTKPATAQNQPANPNALLDVKV